jgi:hypothetical protein
MKSNPTSTRRLEAELRQARPVASLPDDLHNSILGAVRSAGKPVEAKSASPFGRWAVAAVFVVLVAAYAWRGDHRSSAGGHSWEGVDFTLQGTPNIPEQASAVVLSPLSQELELLNSDFRSAMNFLVASVP